MCRCWRNTPTRAPVAGASRVGPRVIRVNCRDARRVACRDHDGLTETGSHGASFDDAPRAGMEPYDRIDVPNLGYSAGAIRMSSKYKHSNAASRFGDFSSMSIDQLWALHEKVCSELTRKVTEEKARIEERLGELRQREMAGHTRRPYPRVSPKFQNPTRPAETWAGRGKRPRWLTAQLSLGKQLNDFRIGSSSGRV
jgi:DNA-binding protein H-NS